ncbi:antitoxin VapB family protein [Candidatus Woesearchaeota archaeon]|nr:antitoxin VapB family protein [Candidatus Woesearchaeota archaeon]
MAKKTISLTEEAYKLLLRNKRPGESFSELIVEGFGKKKRLLDYAGIWESMPADGWKEIERGVAEARKGTMQ